MKLTSAHLHGGPIDWFVLMIYCPHHFPSDAVFFFVDDFCFIILSHSV
jgi:hypothetical protein